MVRQPRILHYNLNTHIHPQLYSIIKDVDIRAVHPDKLEGLAEYMKIKMSEESDNEQGEMG